MLKNSLCSLLFVLVLMLSACGHLSGDALIFHTADPRINIGVRLLPAPPLPATEPTVMPTEEVGEVLPEPLPEPPCVVVKGNIGRTGKIYHIPGQANYEQVKIDEAAGEAFFCSEQEAIDAGFRKAPR